MQFLSGNERIGMVGVPKSVRWQRRCDPDGALKEALFAFCIMTLRMAWQVPDKTGRIDHVHPVNLL
jgi:hypothetical protein